MDPVDVPTARPVRPRRPRPRRPTSCPLRGRLHEPDRPARGPRGRSLPAVGAGRRLQRAAARRVRRPARLARALTDRPSTPRPGARPTGERPTATGLNGVHGSLVRPIVPVMATPVSRRRVLQGLAAGAGLAMVGCKPTWPERAKRPGDRPFPRRPEGVDCLPQIEHIVIYMQENHSYDSYFGTFRRGDGYRMRRTACRRTRNVLPDGTPFPVFHADSTCQPGRGVSQNWNNTHIQIDGGKMDGFLRDGNTNAMKYWDGEDLPFYWSLASHVPAVRPVVHLGAVPDVPQPAVPAGGHVVRAGEHRHRQGPQTWRRRPTAPSGSGSTPTASRGTTTPGTCPTSCSCRRSGRPTRTG